MTPTQSQIMGNLEALHQHSKLNTGTYEYQCGFLDALKLSKEAILQSALDTKGDKQCGDHLEMALNRKYSPEEIKNWPDAYVLPLKDFEIIERAASAHLAAIKGG